MQKAHNEKRLCIECLKLYLLLKRLGSVFLLKLAFINKLNDL